MGSSGFSYILVVIFIMCSAFFSGSETALTSVNKIRLKNMAENGDKRAARTLRVAEDYEQMISTVLIGNNIVNTGSASVATVLFTMWLGADKGAAVSTVVMTIIVLIFGEVVPKNYGKANADSLAMFVSGPISVLMVIFKPLSFILGNISKFVIKITGSSDD